MSPICFDKGSRKSGVSSVVFRSCHSDRRSPFSGLFEQRKILDGRLSISSVTLFEVSPFRLDSFSFHLHPRCLQFEFEVVKISLW